MLGILLLSISPIFFIIISSNYGFGGTTDVIKIQSEHVPSLYESNIEHDGDEWKLRYFPDEPLSSPSSTIFADRQNMSNVPAVCDDGKTNITIDWDGSPVNFTCQTTFFPTDCNIEPIIHNDVIPPGYQAPHYCMNTKINYSQVMTTFGAHRPLWAKYGEYQFLPRQRWLHNSEHGAVIMLYHPCANSQEVDKLRCILIQCLRRHIITPYNLLSSERPLALFTWGWYLSMNTVDPKLVRDFIVDHALHGAENESADGEFDQDLITAALVVSDQQDSVVCPSNVHE